MDVAQVLLLDRGLSVLRTEITAQWGFSRILRLISTNTHFSRSGAISLSGHTTVRTSATAIPIDTSANR